MSSNNILMNPIQFRLLKTLCECGALTRKELCKKLNTPWTTTFDNLERLEKKEYVKRFSKETGRKGRPPVFWEIDNLNPP